MSSCLETRNLRKPHCTIKVNKRKTKLTEIDLYLFIYCVNIKKHTIQIRLNIYMVETEKETNKKH